MTDERDDDRERDTAEQDGGVDTRLPRAVDEAEDTAGDADDGSDLPERPDESDADADEAPPTESTEHEPDSSTGEDVASQRERDPGDPDETESPGDRKAAQRPPESSDDATGARETGSATGTVASSSDPEETDQDSTTAEPTAEREEPDEARTQDNQEAELDDAAAESQAEPSTETVSPDGVEQEILGDNATPPAREGEGDRLEELEDMDADLRPRELERAFDILEEALTNQTIGGQQVEQLLTVMERAVATPEETDPETVAELMSMLEELIIEPDDLSDIDLGGFLSIFEEAITGTTSADREEVADMFEVVQEGIRDPTGIEPEDIDRFQSGLESAFFDFTDPSSGGVGSLLSMTGLMGGETPPPEADAADGIDMFRLARIAAGMTQRATGYSMESGIRTGTRMAYAAANSKSPAELLTNSRAIALDELQRAGIDIGDEQQTWLETHEDDLVDPRPVTREALEERGEELLAESAEIGRDEPIHPAFPIILEQLATDEARILRLLATDGPQSAIDVYERKLIPFRSKRIAENMTMIGSDAGCRNPKQTPVYLQNLTRLGLVEIVEDPVSDLKNYQILEAQPHVEMARDSAKRTKTAYKSVHLTDFGATFCEMCFPFEVAVEELSVDFRSEVESK
jgi:hypothetical protein